METKWLATYYEMMKPLKCMLMAVNTADFKKFKGKYWF